MTKFFKKPLSIILAVLMVMSVFIAVPMTASALTEDDVESLLNSMRVVIYGYADQNDFDHVQALSNYYVPLSQAFEDANLQVTPEVESAYNAAYAYFYGGSGGQGGSGGGNNPASSLAFTKVTDASQIADDNISTCTKSEAKAWIKANWDDIMSNAGSGQYASFGFLYHHANGDLYHIGFPKDIEDNDFDNMVDEQSVSLTPVGEGEGLSLSVVIDWYQNDGDNYTPYICTGAGSSAGSVFNGTYPNANNVYINTGGAPTDVTIADLEVGDVIISSPSGHMSVSKGDCTIILAGGTVGNGDPNMGELMDVYDDDATLNGSVNFSFNDEFGYARIVDMSNNYKDYYAVYNNSLGNSFMVVGKNGNTVVLAGYHATLHTITWQVGTDTNQILAVEGSVPSYSGSTEKSPDAQWDYTFTGWKDSSNTFYEDGADLPAVTKDETYTAQYSSSARHYDIFWNNWNGTRLKSEFLAYGATPTPPETPTRAEDDDYTYEFAGWNPAVTTVTTGRAYYATFTPVPKVVAHTHSATHYPAVEATFDAPGNIEYWYCDGCEKYFSDANCENEITQAQTVVAQKVAVCRIDDKKYETFAEAAGQGSYNATSNPDGFNVYHPIVLLDDISDTYYVDSVRNTIVYANGHTVDVQPAANSGLLMEHATQNVKVTSISSTKITVDIYRAKAAEFKVVHNNVETLYPSLDAALAAVQDGDTVVLVADSYAGLGNRNFNNGKDFTLDLNGKTVSGGNGFSVSDGTGVTFVNGTINMEYQKNIDVYGDLTFGDGCTVTGQGTVYLESGSVTVEDGASFTTTQDIAIATNGSESDANATINITGGSVTAEKVAVYLPKGNLNVSGGTLTGETAVYVKSGNVDISGGTFVATGDKADYEAVSGGCKPTGDAIVIENGNYPGGAPTATISGGTFTSANGSSVGAYVADDSDTVEVTLDGVTVDSVSAGENATFNLENNAEIEDYNLPEGLSIQTNPDGSVTVLSDSDFDYVTGDKLGFNFTDTFEAGAGDTLAAANGYTSLFNYKLLGVQVKNSVDALSSGGNDVRFVSVINTEILKDADEYGYVFAKFDSVADARAHADEIQAHGSKVLTKECTTTSNTISGDYGLYNEDTNYKYVTATVNGIGDDVVAARFYIRKGNTYYYADYTNDQNETYSVCAAAYSDLT